MADLTTHLVELDLEAGLIDGKSMSIQIETTNDYVKIDCLKEKQTIKINCCVPGNLQIVTSMKNAFDTKVDDNGNIIADKYIKLTGLRLDGLSVDENYLPRFIQIQTEEHGKINSNYWGFNGEIQIDIAPTAFKWLAGTKRL